MLIKIGNFDYTEYRDGVFYKKLSDYPDISEREIQSILDFINYESKYGHSSRIGTEQSVLDAIEHFKAEKRTERISVPEKITECTACPTYNGCMTDLVCHTFPIENAPEIFDCGSLLSPVRARKMTAAELKAEKRNAANDPEDYFEYIMFAWGNCQAGDRLVTERKPGRSPGENDPGAGFTAGVRFFFKFDVIKDHPDAVFEGVLPLKIKDEIILRDWVHAIIVPGIYRQDAEKHIPDDLGKKIHFLENNFKNIREWSEKVYEYAKKL